jgi:hypothetical protein
MKVLDAGKANDKNHDYWLARAAATEIVTVAKMDQRTIDYYVGVAEGVMHPPMLRKMEPGFTMVQEDSFDEDGPVRIWVAFQPSSDPKHGHDIIERERISLDTWQGKWGANYGLPVEGADEDHNPGHHRQNGETFLEAAMRCYVSRKFGSIFYVLPDGTTLPYLESTEKKRRAKEKNDNVAA